MDEMESSELRGKVSPATDSHKLPIIHAHGGASSALSHSNKPDELEEAIQYFEKIIGYSNHVGLLSEDIKASDGSMWGNFPQAYSHVGLLNAAHRIAKKIDLPDFRL